MTDTIREIITQDFMAQAELITTGNGYATGIGARVLRARKKIDPPEVPATVILPGEETAEAKYGKYSCKMIMRVEGVMVFGNSEPSVISEKILGDIKKCILSDSWTRSPDYISGIVYTGGGISEPPDDDQATTTGAYANFEVSYISKRNDPTSP